MLLQQSLGFLELLCLVDPLLLVLGGFERGFFLLRLEHMLWSPGSVLHSLGLLAAVALLAPFEVVVLALGALPATVWELERGSIVLLVLTSHLLVEVL